MELDLVEEIVPLPERELSILRPRSSEALLDESAFEHEEFLPYWAELWPSGVALARMLSGRALRGARTLELGCGLALPSIAAALAGARVVATDWSPDALELAELNAARNGVSRTVSQVFLIYVGTPTITSGGSARPREARHTSLFL